MHKKVEKFKEVLEQDLANMLDSVNSAGAIGAKDIETIENAVELMLKIQEYEDCMIYGNPDNTSFQYRDAYSGRRGRDPMTGRYVSRSTGYYDPYYGRQDIYDPYYLENSRADMGRNGGYSSHSIKDRMIAKLESMYDDAKTDHEKQIVDEWIKRIESEK